MDIATAFGCNISQLSKAVTGVDYKLGPHHYVPKKKTDAGASSSKGDQSKQGPPPAKKTKHPTTSKLRTMTQPDKLIPDMDTLSE